MHLRSGDSDFPLQIRQNRRCVVNTKNRRKPQRLCIVQQGDHGGGQPVPGRRQFQRQGQSFRVRKWLTRDYARGGVFRPGEHP